MEIIYVIKNAFYDKKDEKLYGFKNLYAVKDEITAKNDCIRLQSESNKDYEGCYFKFVYKYEVLKLFPF